MFPESDAPEQESLALIESMIRKAKNQFTETGHLYLLWGWVVLGCSLLEFILMVFTRTDKHYYVWFATWAVFIYQAIYLVRRKKREKVKTYTSDIMAYVWTSFVIAMFLMYYIIGYAVSRGGNAIYPGTFYPMLFVLYGIPIFLSGIILRFRPLVTGGICCWLISLVAPFFPFAYQLLLLAAIMAVAWIRPGYLLQARHKSLNR